MDLAVMSVFGPQDISPSPAGVDLVPEENDP